MTTISTRLFTTAALPPELRALHTMWDQTCFTEPNDYRWAHPQWHIFVYADGVPVSYVGLFARNCTLDGRPLRLAGVGSVMTPGAHRRRGYASAGLIRANAAMPVLTGAAFAQLVTGPPLIPLYEKLGWQHITDPMLVRLPDGTPRQYSDVVMIRPLGDAPWPGGTLDLCGFPW